jgi:hypothetical protein
MSYTQDERAPMSNAADYVNRKFLGQNCMNRYINGETYAVTPHGAKMSNE